MERCGGEGLPGADTNLYKGNIRGNYRLFLFLSNFCKRIARHWSNGRCTGIVLRGLLSMRVMIGRNYLLTLFAFFIPVVHCSADQKLFVSSLMDIEIIFFYMYRLFSLLQEYAAIHLQFYRLYLLKMPNTHMPF